MRASSTQAGLLLDLGRDLAEAETLLAVARQEVERLLRSRTAPIGKEGGGKPGKPGKPVMRLGRPFTGADGRCYLIEENGFTGRRGLHVFNPDIPAWESLGEEPTEEEFAQKSHPVRFNANPPAPPTDEERPLFADIVTRKKAVVPDADGDNFVPVDFIDGEFARSFTISTPTPDMLRQGEQA